MADDRRSLEQLLEVDDPAWPEVERLLSGSDKVVCVLAPEEGRRERVIEALQVTLWSTLGALVWNTGGVVLQGGWIRLYGSGCASMGRDPMALPAEHGWYGPDGRLPTIVPVAEDVLGGIFALNWTGLDPEGRFNEVFYFAPDSLRWEPMEIKHSALVRALLGDQLAGFNDSLRWPQWEQEVEGLDLNAGLHVWPPLWTREGRDFDSNSRRAVPLAQIMRAAFRARDEIGS